MIDCAHGCPSYCFAKAAVMAQLPNLSPFFDDFDKRMIDVNSEHVSETEIRDFKIQDATASRTRWLIKDWD